MVIYLWVMKKFYTYIDWTLEENPRAFYIGKGNDQRTRKPERNKKHKYVCNTYGFNREIIFCSNDEKNCLEYEVELIKEYHTFYLDEFADKEVACNFTKGGDGSSGWVPTEEQRKNISKGIKLAYKNNPELGKKISKHAKIRMNNPQFVSKLSEKIKESLRNMPEEKKKEMIRKNSDSRKGKISPQRGANSWRTSLNDEIVKEIKKDYKNLIFFYKKTKSVNKLCEKYNQSFNTIYKIVSGVTWKHIEE